MGWSISCILISERENGFLGTFPAFDHDSAVNIVNKLGLGPLRTSSISNLELGLDNRNGWFTIGAYEGAAIISGLPGMFGCGQTPSNKVLISVLDIFPRAKVLAMELASATNYFGFILYENRHLIRGFAGDAEGGVIFDEGAKQPEESEIISKCKHVDWRQSGEELVFALSARFFGRPLDQYDAEKLVVEVIRLNSRGLAFQLFKAISRLRGEK